ncbi:hypothetical protein B0H14DRAFT_3488879 [Mycena olivaceomarginata]|nr:hypothetical protein B0H14DRAFT_3488879 [Mycena olivaceomarginata]
MSDSARPSDLLRIWLPPPRFNSPQNTASPRKTRTTESWTKISDRQVKTAGELSLNDSWSIEQKLAVDLIDAVSLDLDILLPPHPKLASSLKKVITTLEEQWNKHFEDNSRWRPSNTPGLESVTERATNILFDAVADAWSHIQATQPTDREPQQIEIGCKQAPSFLPGSGFVDKKISIEEGCYIAVWEDKRPRGFTSVLANLSQRAGHGAFNSDISSALSADFVQRPWWILANKGLFYVGLYGVNWIIFSGVTGFCVGHRMNKHMFWSGPVYNRRDKGQELVDETPDGIYTFFGDAPHPNKRQIDVFLLFLAVVLRGAYDKGNSPWVKTLFAKLCALSFTPPSTENTPSPSPFTPTGEDVNVAAEPDDDNVSSDNSDDHDYTPSASNRTSASTTLLWGPHQLTGRWYGDLGDPDDYGVRLLHLLASGPQNSVYAGELFQKDKYIAAVAIKASEDRDALMTEFQRYQALQRRMGDAIPQCYGLCVRGNTSYLVTSLVPNDTADRELTKAERGSLRPLHVDVGEPGALHTQQPDLQRKAL